MRGGPTLPRRLKPRLLRIIAIVHGKSEYQLCACIKSNLRIKHEVIGKDKGEHSIQVTSILGMLESDSRFRSFSGFRSSFRDIDVVRNRIGGIKIFIIMDVDDCSEAQKRDFINKEMFRGHWLYDYIIPIYNDPKFEATLKEADIPYKQKRDYVEIFPTNHGDLDLNIAKEYEQKFRSCKCTNLEEYLCHCITIAEENMD
jgi:hypothetical protein